MTNKSITDAQIREQASKLGVEAAALKAVIEVEAKSSGFNQDGTPVILYERHKFYEGLRAINWITKAREWFKQYPDLCNPSPGGYGKYSEQHGKLARASELNREVALESCSWGLGQVMGYHWKSLGYESLQSFINAMYKDEASQLDAMCRYISVNNLVNAVRSKDWKAFARGYNGKNYAINSYDTKLATAYAKWKKVGF